jgi:hypothetical protein
MAVGGRISHILSGLLIGLLLGGAPRPARASDGSKGSNDSSKGSTDSSNSSTDSSNNSNDSSNRSENSTEGSPKESTEGTSDGSSKNKGAVLVTVALGLVAVGATTLGVVRALAQVDERKRTRQLANFLQRNHALVARDVVLAEGPVLADWARALGLSAAERERLGQALEGSSEQGELLAALDGRIDEARARRFAIGFAQLGRRALGESRFRAIALAATR